MSRQRRSGDNPAGEGGQASPRAITILGAPVEAGAGVPGAAMGPAMLRTAGIVETLRDLGHDVEDKGDLAIADPLANAAAPDSKAHRFADVAAWARVLASINCFSTAPTFWVSSSISASLLSSASR